MSASQPRILFFGTGGAFSAPPLAALLAEGFPVAAVVLPADRPRPGEGAPPPLRQLVRERAPRLLPMLAGEPALPDLARERDIPLFELARPDDPVALAGLAALAPDLIGVACFPRRLPPALLALAPWGGLNLHPSLLPRHRGPAPLFWTFYHGDSSAGVSVHIMTDRIDAGNLLLQAPVPIPDGATGPEVERACATAGAALLASAARGWTTGALAPWPQDEAKATRAPWPTPRDRVVPTTWTARRAARFIRGVSAWYPLTLAVPTTEGTRMLRIGEVLGVAAENALPADAAYRQGDGDVWVRFREGVLRLREPRPSADA